MIELKRPLVSFDLETTGANKKTCKVVQFGAIKLMPNGEQHILELLINPCQVLSSEIEQLTGISNSELVKANTFEHEAHKIYQFMKDCDFLGYNLTHFDLPVLLREMQDAGIEFPQMGEFEVVDAQAIYHSKEGRSLSDAMQFYCNTGLKDAHTAIADAAATLAVFEAQLKRYKDLPSTIEGFTDISYRGKKLADISGLIYVDKDEYLRFNFGKNKDELLRDNIRYIDWMCRSDFPQDTLAILNNFLRNYFGEDDDNTSSEVVIPTKIEIQNTDDTSDDLPF